MQFARSKKWQAEIVFPDQRSVPAVYEFLSSNKRHTYTYTETHSVIEKRKGRKIERERTTTYIDKRRRMMNSVRWKKMCLYLSPSIPSKSFLNLYKTILSFLLTVIFYVISTILIDNRKSKMVYLLYFLPLCRITPNTYIYV